MFNKCRLSDAEIAARTKKWLVVSPPDFDDITTSVASLNMKLPSSLRYVGDLGRGPPYRLVELGLLYGGVIIPAPPPFIGVLDYYGSHFTGTAHRCLRFLSVTTKMAQTAKTVPYMLIKSRASLTPLRDADEVQKAVGPDFMPVTAIDLAWSMLIKCLFGTAPQKDGEMPATWTKTILLHAKGTAWPVMLYWHDGKINARTARYKTDWDESKFVSWGLCAK